MPAAGATGSRRSLLKRGWPIHQRPQPLQRACRPFIDTLPGLQRLGVKAELFAVGQHLLGGQPQMGDYEPSEIGAGRGYSAIDQLAVFSRGPHFDASIAGTGAGSVQGFSSLYCHCSATQQAIGDWHETCQHPRHRLASGQKMAALSTP